MTLPVLDRIPFQDHRSLGFGIAREIPTDRARSYSWRINTAGVLDQGVDGHCVGFGWGAELAARPVEVRGVTNQFAHDLFYRAQAADRRDGRYYEDGATMLAGAKALKATGYIDGYRWAFGLQDVVATLGFFGPVVLGVDWFTGMFYPTSDGTIRPTGRVEGGHCLVARAIKIVPKQRKLFRWTQPFSNVDLERSAVTLRQSWGGDHGARGDVRMTLADLDTLLRRQGEACVPVGRHLSGTL